MLPVPALLWWRDQAWKQRRKEALPLPSVVFFNSFVLFMWDKQQSHEINLGCWITELVSHSSPKAPRVKSKLTGIKSSFKGKFIWHVMLSSRALQCAWTNIWSQDIHCRNSQGHLVVLMQFSTGKCARRPPLNQPQLTFELQICLHFGSAKCQG